jgi:uncharacterized membrane protein YcaP (DUF421 family)
MSPCWVVCRASLVALFSMNTFLEPLLGLHASPNDISWSQIIARTTTVFLFGVLLVRLADRRFLGRNAGFDVLLAIVLGSVLSRAINGQAPFFKTLAASALLVLLHRVVAALSCRWSAFSNAIKGKAIVLVRDGRVMSGAMRAADISQDDLEENLRLHANLTAVSEVAEARLERNGSVSVTKRQAKA